MLFYNSKSSSLSYSDIIAYLKETSVVKQNYLAKEYQDFILNVISGIIHDVDMTLVDYRNTNKETNHNTVSVQPKEINSSQQLVDAITASEANIGIYSSGTTAEPKLIYQTVARLMKSVRISDDYTNSRWGFTYNPSHSAGIQVFLQAICNQAILFDLYKCSRSEILETLKQDKITHLSATPTFYRMLAPYDFDLPDLKSVTFNGEKSTIELIESIKSRCSNVRIRNIYGSTESGPLMSSESTTFKVPERLLKNIKIVNEELMIKGHLISKSVNNLEWYPTGDLVRVINQNPLTIEFISRKTSILNVGGQNVNPQEVEETLIKHPFVKDARVYGRPNKMIGNLIVAEVQVLDNETIKEKELINWCKEKLASYKVPRMIKFVDKIEVGRTGKKML